MPDVALVYDQDVHEKMDKAELDVKNGHLSRRALITYVGAWACAAAGRNIARNNHAIPELCNALKLDRLHDNEEHRALVKSFLGVHDDTSFVPGVVHYRFPGRKHPSDIRTLAPIAKKYFSEDRIVELGNNNQLLYITNINTSIFCAGGPVSNQASRLVLQYEPAGADPALGVKRIQEPVFHLRYEYIGDAGILDRNRMQIIDGIPHDVANWLILDTQTSQPVTPRKRTKVSDYLLITVLPQVFDSKGYEREQKIIIAGGGHGIGTLATGLILENPAIIRKLSELVDGKKYWQAVIPVTETSIEKHSTIPTRIDLDGIMISSIDFDQPTLERAFLGGTALRRATLDFRSTPDSLSVGGQLEVGPPHGTPESVSRVEPHRGSPSGKENELCTFDQANQLLIGFELLDKESSGVTRLFEEAFEEKLQKKHFTSVPLPVAVRMFDLNHALVASVHASLPEAYYRPDSDVLLRGLKWLHERDPSNQLRVTDEFRMEVRESMNFLAKKDPRTMEILSSYIAASHRDLSELLRAGMLYFYEQRNVSTLD